MYEDLFLKIGEYLTNKEKIALSMTSHVMDKLKYKFIYNEKVHVKKILDLSFINNFKFIDITGVTCMYPKAKYIYLQTYDAAIPPYVTHLTFDDAFNKSIDGYLPTSVTHLTLGYNFNQPINNVPASITHLTFGDSFNQPINKISQYITHLTFGEKFNHPINNLIPQTVTHLTFGNKFNHPIDNLINLYAKACHYR